jgi:tetratricopeptide (TPR) repeat protein
LTNRLFVITHLKRAAVLWFLCASLSACSLAQVKEVRQSSANTPSTTRVAIHDFKKLQGDGRFDVLEETLPQLLRAGLFSQQWMNVTLIGTVSPGNTGTGQGTSLSSSSTDFDLMIEGEFFQISENRIRVSIVVNDMRAHGVIFRDSVDLESDQILAGMGQASDRIGGGLREIVLKTKTADHLIAVVGPFENSITDPKLGFLPTSLPLAIAGDSERTPSLKNLEVQVANAASGPGDIQVTGKISLVGDSILITATYQERKTGLSLVLEHRGPASEPLKAMSNISRKVWDVLGARVTPAGGFRNEPVLFGDRAPEQLFARGEEYEKSSEDSAALLMYGLAVQKKPDFLAARLRIAEIYRRQESYELAEDQYKQVLAQSSQSAAAHLGVGLLYSKQGVYERAVAELDQALALSRASAESRLEFETLMALGDVYLLMKQPDRSVQYFSQALTINKESVAPYLSLGRVCRAKDDLDCVIDYLRKGLAHWPQDTSLKNDLATALNDLARKQRDAKEYAKAVETLQKTIDLDPPNVRLKATAYRQAGITLGWDLNDIAKGVTFLEKAAELAPGEELNFRALGFGYEKAGKRKEAIVAFNRAIAITPQYESYWEIGYIYRLLDEYDLGIATAQKAVQMDSDKADGYILLGALYQSKFESSKDDQTSFHLAEDNLKQGIQHDPRSESANRVLALLYEQAADRAESAAPNSAAAYRQNAIVFSKQAISIEPSASSYHVLGTAYWKLKQTNDAIDALLAGLKLDRQYESIYYDLEKIYAESDQSDKFVQLLKETTELQPKFIFPYIKLGLATRHTKPEEALGWLQKAVDLNPKSEWAQRVMGLTYKVIAERDKSQADYDRAINCFNTAIQIDPTAASYSELGAVYAVRGENEKAKLNLEKAIALDPEDVASYETLGPLYDKEHRGNDFNQLLESAVAKKTDFYWAELELAKRYSSLGKYDDAIGHFNKAIAIRPDSYEAYWQLAQAERLKPNQELDKAYEHARKAVDLSPKSTDALIELVDVWIVQKEYGKAIQELETRLKDDPKSALFYALLGEAHRREKAFPKAYDSFNKAIELSPKYVYAHRMLGQTYADDKKFPEAFAIAKELVTSQPETSTALGLLYNSGHEIGKDQEVFQFLEQLRKDHPGNAAILSALGFVSHEFIKDYQKSYEVYRELYNLPENKDDVSTIEDFAEANLSVEKLDVVLELTTKAVSSKNIPIQGKLSMKLFQIAAYLLRGEQGRAFAELGVFRDEYRQVPKDYERRWTFDGTRSFVQSNTKLKPAERALLLRMMELLDAPQEKADAKLKEFEASFAEIFADLKAAAASDGKPK